MESPAPCVVRGLASSGCVEGHFDPPSPGRCHSLRRWRPLPGWRMMVITPPCSLKEARLPSTVGLPKAAAVVCATYRLARPEEVAASARFVLSDEVGEPAPFGLGSGRALGLGH